MSSRLLSIDAQRELAQRRQEQIVVSPLPVESPEKLAQRRADSAKLSTTSFVHRQSSEAEPVASGIPAGCRSPSSTSTAPSSRPSSISSFNSPLLPSAVPEGSDSVSCWTGGLLLLKLSAPVVCKLCTLCLGQRTATSAAFRKDAVSLAPERTWYMIHPDSDTTWYVRRDTGPENLRSRTQVQESEAEDKKNNIERSAPPPLLKASRHSVPNLLERSLGLEDPEGFERDAFSDDCKICYEKRSEVIVLPCRHGCLCEECLRKQLFSRPDHRGGRSCPYCRRRIKEIVRIYRDGGITQYGYAIKV